MTNAEALTSFVEWWKSVPNSRRPGEEGHFSMTPSAVEQYVRDLRETWFKCGVGILRICEPHREALARDAVLSIDDLFAWLDRIEAKLERREVDRNAVSSWARKWRQQLAKARSDPLRDAPGLFLGAGPGSTLLADFRWWGELAGLPTGPGGPLGNAPQQVQDELRGLAFPESVNEFQHAVAKSPWTAAYVLNWLLSDKGVLPESRKAPAFKGPPAVPHARFWLDQMDTVFGDWRASKFEGRKRPGLRLENGRLIETAPSASNPRFDAAISQISSPVLPSTYIVPVGEETLDLKGHVSGSPSFLNAREGQCCVFEFLSSRVALLENIPSNFNASLAAMPELVIVDGKRKGTFAVQVGVGGTPRKLSRGGAKLLWTLNRDGIVTKRVLWAVVDEVRRVISEVAEHIKPSKKTGNGVKRVEGDALRGQVVWKSSNRQVHV